MIRDKDGLLKCQYCARRFFTKIVLQNHSTSVHKNDDVVTKLDQLLSTENEESASQTDTSCPLKP